MNTDIFRWNVLLTSSEKRFLTHLNSLSLPRNLAKRVDALLKYHKQSKLDRRKAAEAVCRDVGLQTAHFLSWVEHFKHSRTRALIVPTSKKAGKQRINPEIKANIRKMGLGATLGNARTRSTRSIAQELGVSHNTVARILREGNTKSQNALQDKPFGNPSPSFGKSELIGFYAHRSTLVMAFRNVPRLRITIMERGRKRSNLPGPVQRRTTDSYRTGIILLTAILRFDFSDSNRAKSKKGFRTSASAYAYFLRCVNDHYASHDRLTFIVKSGYNGQEPEVQETTFMFPRVYCMYRNTVDPWFAAIAVYLAFIAKESGIRQKCESVYALLIPLIDYIQLPERDETPFLWVKNMPMNLVRFNEPTAPKPL